MASRRPSAQHIVKTAIMLAEQSSWEQVHLYAVADSLGVGLAAIHRHFREKDDVIDAWLDQADQVMLQAAEHKDFQSLSPRARIYQLIMAWLDVLQAHRKVAKQMLHHKLKPGHVRAQVSSLLRVKRTVQWLREAAHRDAGHLQQMMEETGLTTIFILTLCHWLADESVDMHQTHQYLASYLAGAEQIVESVAMIPWWKVPLHHSVHTH